MELTLMIILASLLFSAFFSGMELAFITANRLQVELELKQGKSIAKIIEWFMRNRSRFIAAMLVGNNIALVIYGIFMAQLIEPYIIEYIWPNYWFVLLMQTVISTVIVLFVAEFLPKSLFRINPNGFLNVLAIPVLFIYLILYIPAYVITLLSEVILKLLFKVEPERQEVVFNQVDLHNFLLEKTSAMDEDEEVETEIQIFQNALEFSKIKARECMIPRNEIRAIDIEDELSVLTELFVETGHSKVLVYRENIDHVIGYVHSSELFKHPDTVKSILRPIAMIPESKTANDILEQLISQRRNVAVVLDEYGGTAGMLTIEDVIEELFGDIEDEHDKEDLVEVELGEGRYRFAARHEVDYLNDNYSLGLPESEEFDTLAGLILHYHEDIPQLKERITVHPFRFVITKVQGHRIEELELTVLQDS
ncbi:MAG: HlyC/CorC family transporter [Flavobacteriales bacterium]|nr:HlyC/CorC family transporter [Flavobacteriales bacterium]